MMTLPRDPWRRPAAAALFAPLAALYRLGWWLSRCLHRGRPGRVEGAVVLSVGNLSVGGTGKSFLARDLAERALRAGLKPAIVLRGYRAAPGPRPLRVASGGPACGDEAFEHAEISGADVWIDPDRLRGARAAAAAGARCVVLDDGFQRRWQVARDLDLLAADYGELMAGERLLPAGPFREPWSQAALADAVVVSGAPDGLVGEALRARLPRPWRLGRVFRLDRVPAALEEWPAGRRRPLGALKGRRVAALSGLGRPERFEATLASLGAEVLPWRFPDHHPFTPAELERPPRGAEWVVTTAKDKARLPAAAGAGLKVFVLRARARVAPGAEFSRMVAAVLRGDQGG